MMMVKNQLRVMIKGKKWKKILGYALYDIMNKST
jgi:hypothetical protein